MSAQFDRRGQFTTLLAGGTDGHSLWVGVSVVARLSPTSSKPTPRQAAVAARRDGTRYSGGTVRRSDRADLHPRALDEANDRTRIEARNGLAYRIVVMVQYCCWWYVPPIVRRPVPEALAVDKCLEVVANCTIRYRTAI